MRGPRTAMKSGLRLPQLEEALAQKRRPVLGDSFWGAGVGGGAVVSAYHLFNFPLPSSQNLNYLSLWTTSTNKASFSPVPIHRPLTSPGPPRAPRSQHSFSFLRWRPQSPAGQREFHPRKATVIPWARGRRPKVGGRGGRAEEGGPRRPSAEPAPHSVRTPPPSQEVEAPPPNVRGRK